MGEQFVPIQMRTLQGELPFHFDLYVKVNSKYLLYLRTGDSIEGERLNKLREYKGERFFINKQDLPVFKDFIGELLDEALEVKLTTQKDISQEMTDKSKQHQEEGTYFHFDDLEKEKKQKPPAQEEKTNVKLSPHIKSLMASQAPKGPSRPTETAEQKLNRQIQVINSVAKTAIDIINRILSDPDSLVAYQVLQKASRGLKAAVIKGTPFFVKLYYLSSTEERPLIEHSKNVALLSLQLGVTCKLPDEQLENLAIASMLHDLGLTQYEDPDQVQANFLTPKDQLSAEEASVYDQHVLKSKELMEEKNFIPKSIIELVEAHEENLSGTGPLGKTNLELPQQILSLSNKYEKLMREQKLNPKMAMQEISINQVGNYDLKLIEKLKNVALLLSKGQA